MKTTNKVLTTIICLLIIGSTKYPSTYAYFKLEKQAPIDLIFTTGSLDVSVQPGINISLKPGESSDYQNFKITNQGSLNQNIDIIFDNFSLVESEIDDEYLKNITYQLQIKDNQNNYNTVIENNLSELKSKKINYLINSYDTLDFKSKIYISEEINEELYDKTINFQINIKAYQTNDPNYSYFTDKEYQQNSITIEKPKTEEPSIYNFVTTGKISNGSAPTLTISLKDHYDVDMSFKFKINNTYGQFSSDSQIVVPNMSSDIIRITFGGKYIEIDSIDTELPSKDKMDVEITYVEDNQTYKKQYTVEFIRQIIDTVNEESIYHNENVEVYFYERN